MTRIYDVTVPLSADMPTYPGDTPYSRRILKRMEDGDPSNLSDITLSSHAGTHEDAPLHFVQGGAPVDELPLEILMGRARVVAVAVTRPCIDRSDLEGLDLADDVRILFKTGNAALLQEGGFQPHFVYLTEAAAHFLVDAGIKLVGIDYLSVERFDSHDFAAHRALLGAGVVVVEGLDLRDVDEGSYELTCLPLRLQGGEGAPARAVLRRRT
jgi:arylformamidase